MKNNKFVFIRPTGEEVFVCHRECVTVDELVEIGKELGVIKDG